MSGSDPNKCLFFPLHVSTCVLYVPCIHVLMWIGTHEFACVWRLGALYQVPSTSCYRGTSESRACQIQFLTHSDCSSPGITGGPRHPWSISTRAGNRTPRSHICMASPLTTEPPFQPHFSSFNPICQIIQTAFSCRMMTNHLIIIAPLQNCIPGSQIHGNTWLCHTSNTPKQTELRRLYPLSGTLWSIPRLVNETDTSGKRHGG